MSLEAIEVMVGHIRLLGNINNLKFYLSAVLDALVRYT